MRGVCTPAALGLLAGLMLGCGGSSKIPMKTDGPNQVIIQVPGMT